MKGIVLAGGSGSRLYPITKGVSKHLLPIYDKPMVFYPISILMLAGIRNILIITTENDLLSYKRLLGDGSNFGVKFSYKVQKKPDGLAQAFIIGEDFIGNENVCLVLGDNIFYGQDLSSKLSRAVEAAANEKKATVFGYQVKDPQRFGVVSFNKKNLATEIEEKPNKPKSNYAVTGLYFYPNSVINVAKKIKPSSRNELEITSVNKYFLEKKKLNVELLGRGFAWLDTGTHDSMLEASQFVHIVEQRQGYKIACLEEIALSNKWISKEDLKKSIKKMPNNGYKMYIKQIL